MKKRLLLVFAFISIVFMVNALAEIPVTFQVNMRVKALEGLFRTNKDSVTICGTFISETGLGGDWDCSAIPALSDEDLDSIYSITVGMDDSAVGQSFMFKYQMNRGETWEDGSDRTFTLVSPETILPVAWFGRDSVVTFYDFVENTLIFTADLSDILGTGDDYFDPSTDKLKLYGFDEHFWEKIISEDSTRYLTEVPFSAALYTCTVTVRGLADSTTGWKVKAGPSEKYQNYGGWEVSTKRRYTYAPDGSTIEIDQFKPSVFPVVGELSQDVTVLFQVDMSNPRNRHNNELVDPSTITHVGMKGACTWLTDRWAGDWTLNDTVTIDPSSSPTMLMLNDNGINGDKQAGDNIWSINATYESGTEGGIRMWKYCMFYPGAEDVTAVSGAVFENEFVYTDRHHWINVLDDEPTMETNDIFNYDSNGLNSFPEESSIESEKELKPEEFKLCQNYPNPFNPTTMIEYQLPSRQLVELKVFNTLGMEVKTLVQKTQDSGKYHVLFNASKLSSGVYFCQMRVGEFTQTRKMLFLK